MDEVFNRITENREKTVMGHLHCPDSFSDDTGTDL
jgi:hypothetical protein